MQATMWKAIKGNWTTDAQAGAVASSMRPAQCATSPSSQAQSRTHQNDAGLAGSGRAFQQGSHTGKGEGAFLFVITLCMHTF